MGRRQRAGVRAGDGDVHRDPPGRELRPHDAVGRAAPAPQPDVMPCAADPSRPTGDGLPRRCRAVTRRRRVGATSVAWAHACRPSIVPAGAPGAVRSVTDRLLPRRRGAHRTPQLGARTPSGWHVRAADRGHRRRTQPARVDPGHHRRAGLDRHRRDDPHFEGPYFQSEYAAAHTAAAQRLFESGHAYYCDLTAEQVQGARQGARDAPATTGTPAIAVSDRPRAGCCGSACPTACVGRARPRPRRREVRPRRDRGLRAAARRRLADVPARQRRRRHRDGHHPRRARRGAPAQHAQAAAAVAGARPGRRRRGRTSRCWSTSSARSCRSGATRWRSSSTATRATSPRRWSTT